MQSFRERITSRKFLLALVGALAPVLNQLLPDPLSTEQLALIVGVIGTYIIGEGVADAVGNIPQKVNIQVDDKPPVL